MKTKFDLAIFHNFYTSSLYFTFFNNNEEFDYSNRIGVNSISCTPAKFLLTDVDTTKQIAPLFENIGNHSYKVSTKNDMAQQFFNQGLRLTYAFNHAEAHRSFMEASRLDPNLAMAFWGQAYTLGPNINDPLPDEERKNKYNEAIKKALLLLDNVTQKEQDLINALTKRYSTDLDKDVAELNMAYMKAMETVVKTYPNDSDIQTLICSSCDEYRTMELLG